MAKFHHVNLGLVSDDLDAEMRFLVDVLGYRAVEVNELHRWFETDDGTQVHLSIDPDHRPAHRAHVAVEYGAELGGLEDRLNAAGVETQKSQKDGFPPIVICCDPAGNRWELRGEMAH